MYNRKSVVLALVVLLLSLVLAACGGTEQAPAKEEAAPAEEVVAVEEVAPAEEVVAAEETEEAEDEEPLIRGAAGSEYSLGTEVAVSPDSGKTWYKATIVEVEGDEVSVEYTKENGQKGKIPLFPVSPGWFLSLEEAEEQGKVLVEVPDVSDEQTTFPSRLTCDEFELNQFYAVEYNGDWWMAEHDKCLEGNEPQFKIEGITWLEGLSSETVKTIEEAEAEGLTLRSPETKDLTCDGEELANIKPELPQLTKQQKDAIVKAHNDERKLAGVNSKVKWDDKLAEFALGWGNALSGHYDKGVVAPVKNWPHSTGTCYFDTYISDYAPSWMGENIGSIEGFIGEKQYYDDGSCNAPAGKTCGHYITMINPRVTKIACSKAHGGICQYASGDTNSEDTSSDGGDQKDPASAGSDDTNSGDTSSDGGDQKDPASNDSDDTGDTSSDGGDQKDPASDDSDTPDTDDEKQKETDPDDNKSDEADKGEATEIFNKTYIEEEVDIEASIDELISLETGKTYQVVLTNHLADAPVVLDISSPSGEQHISDISAMEQTSEKKSFEAEESGDYKFHFDLWGFSANYTLSVKVVQ